MKEARICIHSAFNSIKRMFHTIRINVFPCKLKRFVIRNNTFKFVQSYLKSLEQFVTTRSLRLQEDNIPVDISRQFGSNASQVNVYDFARNFCQIILIFVKEVIRAASALKTLLTTKSPMNHAAASIKLCGSWKTLCPRYPRELCTHAKHCQGLLLLFL